MEQLEQVQEGFSLVDTFTAKEKQVYALLCQGMTNKEISRELGFHQTTAKFHMKNIFEKLGVFNRASAIAYSKAVRLEVPAVTGGGLYSEKQIRDAAKQLSDLGLVEKKLVNQVVIDLLAALEGKL